MTDHGNMFGAIEFYNEVMRHGIKPIIGCEIYVAPGSRLERKGVDKGPKEYNHHLILLAMNIDRKSTRLNSSHGYISYAVFCLKKKKKRSISYDYSRVSRPYGS